MKVVGVWKFWWSIQECDINDFCVFVVVLVENPCVCGIANLFCVKAACLARNLTWLSPVRRRQVVTTAWCDHWARSIWIAARRSRLARAVRHVGEVSSSLADYLETRKERVLSWNNVVVLCGLGLQSPRLASREAKGIQFSQGNVL